MQSSVVEECLSSLCEALKSIPTTQGKDKRHMGPRALPSLPVPQWGYLQLNNGFIWGS